MSKYSLLGVCQPQRGGLSYFCGLSLPPALQRATDSDRDCRSGDGLSLLIDYLYEQIVGIPSPLSVPLLFLHFPSLQTDICLMIFSLSRSFSCCDLERLRVARSIMSMPSLHRLRDPRGKQEEPDEKSGEDGGRGIANFGKLDSRAGFTVSRETRTPRLD